MNLNLIVSANVRKQMALTGIPRSRIAKRLGVTVSELSHKINGRVVWRVTDIGIMAIMFGIEPAELLR